MNQIVERDKLVEFNKVGSQTLIGVNERKFPIHRGNCFSLYNSKEEESYVKIVNFYVENLEHLIKEKILTMPVKVYMLGKTHGVILDERVPKEYYADKFCTVCCPWDLLPIDQKIEDWAEQLRGEKTVHEFFSELPALTNGGKPVKMYYTRYDLRKAYKDEISKKSRDN